MLRAARERCSSCWWLSGSFCRWSLLTPRGCSVCSGAGSRARISGGTRACTDRERLHDVVLLLDSRYGTCARVRRIERHLVRGHGGRARAAPRETIIATAVGRALLAGGGTQSRFDCV